jgi:hypothetical protein
VFGDGHPFGRERWAATEAFPHEADPSAAEGRIDKKRRELTADLAGRLERQVMTNDVT